MLYRPCHPSHPRSCTKATIQTTTIPQSFNCNGSDNHKSCRHKPLRPPPRPSKVFRSSSRLGGPQMASMFLRTGTSNTTSRPGAIATSIYSHCRFCHRSWRRPYLRLHFSNSHSHPSSHRHRISTVNTSTEWTASPLFFSIS